MASGTTQHPPRVHVLGGRQRATGSRDPDSPGLQLLETVSSRWAAIDRQTDKRKLTNEHKGCIRAERRQSSLKTRVAALLRRGPHGVRCWVGDASDSTAVSAFRVGQRSLQAPPGHFLHDRKKPSGCEQSFLVPRLLCALTPVLDIHRPWSP